MTPRPTMNPTGRGPQRTIVAAIGAIAATVIAIATPGAAGAAACHAESGPARAALVELYTSEGCSSCPPADRALARFAAAGPRVVPIAFHVDDWDSIGWKDPFAQPMFATRQAWEVRANGRRTSFTPHFFVDGAEVRDWRADLDDRVRTAPKPPAARIVIDGEPHGRDALRVRVDGIVAAPQSARGSAGLFVAITESALVSQVDAGENRGARLTHDAVVRRWIGPIAIAANGRASFDRDIALPSPNAGHVAVVAFVQNAATAEVLQAVGTGPCAPT